MEWRFPQRRAPRRAPAGTEVTRESLPGPQRAPAWLRFRRTSEDCRRLATRCDKLAANFLGNIHLAAAIMWWL